MFVLPFERVGDSSEGSTFEAVVPPGPELDDHFPGDPIVPAFVILGWVAGCAFRDPSAVASFRNVKFVKPVRPGDVVRVTCRGDHREADFTVAVGAGSGAVAASGKVSARPERLGS